VPDQQRRLGTAFLDQTTNVGGQVLGVVGGDLGRLRGQVVAAQVRCDDPESRRRERFDLLPPAVPELGEAVQQENQRSLAGLHVVQSLVADLGVAFTESAVLGHDDHPCGAGSSSLHLLSTGSNAPPINAAEKSAPSPGERS
jgi:hypothetical protein